MPEEEIIADALTPEEVQAEQDSAQRRKEQADKETFARKQSVVDDLRGYVAAGKERREKAREQAEQRRLEREVKANAKTSTQGEPLSSSQEQISNAEDSKIDSYEQGKRYQPTPKGEEDDQCLEDEVTVETEEPVVPETPRA